jgi:hypothetical protein
MRWRGGRRNRHAGHSTPLTPESSPATKSVAYFAVIVRSPEITTTDEGGRNVSDKPPRVDIERMKRAYESTRESVRKVPVLTQRAVAHIDKDMHMVGRVGRFVLESDEPPDRGGDDLAPAPLQYIVAGAAF